MTQHLGKPIPSPALMEHIGTRFRRSVESYASSNGIPWVRFGKDNRKVDVMLPHIGAQAAAGRSGVAAIGVSQGSSGSGPPASGTRDGGAAVHVHEGRPQGDLLLPVGRGLRPGGHQGLRLLPLTGPRSGSTATSGPSGRRPRPASGSPPATIPPRCDAGGVVLNIFYKHSWVRQSAPARKPSSRALPLSGSRTRPWTRTGGGPRRCAWTILGSWPWRARSPPLSPRHHDQEPRRPARHRSPGRRLYQPRPPREGRVKT
jgi:hypothetical protein